MGREIRAKKQSGERGDFFAMGWGIWYIFVLYYVLYVLPVLGFGGYIVFGYNFSLLPKFPIWGGYEAYDYF